MLDVRTPIVWNKPKTKIYDYNQQFTSSMYQVGYFPISQILLYKKNTVLRFLLVKSANFAKRYFIPCPSIPLQL